MSYYNVPVSHNVNASNHPWRHLLDLARPHDFVVVKLDIDHAETEASLMHQFMEDPAIHSRVDMLLWEQHWFSATRASKPACSSAAELCIVPGFHRNRHTKSSPSNHTK